MKSIIPWKRQLLLFFKYHRHHCHYHYTVFSSREEMLLWCTLLLILKKVIIIIDVNGILHEPISIVKVLISPRILLLLPFVTKKSRANTLWLFAGQFCIQILQNYVKSAFVWIANPPAFGAFSIYFFTPVTHHHHFLVHDDNQHHHQASSRIVDFEAEGGIPDVITDSAAWHNG